MLMYYKNSRKIVHALRCLWSDKKKLYTNTCLLVKSGRMNSVGVFGE